MIAPVDPLTTIALGDLAARYAQALDRRDLPALVRLFSARGQFRVFDPADSVEPVVECGRDQLGHVLELLGQFDQTLHVVGTAIYDGDNDGVDAEVYCLAHHVTQRQDAGTDLVMHIRYNDRYVRGTDIPWCIQRRDAHVKWTETRPIDGGDRSALYR